jgi:hypothetical protein
MGCSIWNRTIFYDFEILRSRFPWFFLCYRYFDFNENLWKKDKEKEWWKKGKNKKKWWKKKLKYSDKLNENELFVILGKICKNWFFCMYYHLMMNRNPIIIIIITFVLNNVVLRFFSIFFFDCKIILKNSNENAYTFFWLSLRILKTD